MLRSVPRTINCEELLWPQPFKSFAFYLLRFLEDTLYYVKALTSTLAIAVVSLLGLQKLCVRECLLSFISWLFKILKICFLNLFQNVLICLFGWEWITLALGRKIIPSNDFPFICIYLITTEFCFFCLLLLPSLRQKEHIKHGSQVFQV